MLPALPAFDHRAFTYFFDKRIAHIRKRSVSVHAVILFHLHDAVLHQLQLILRQLQPFDDIPVALHDLARGKTGRHID